MYPREKMYILRILEGNMEAQPKLDFFERLFYLSEPGFNFIFASILIVIVVGLLLTILFRKNLTDKKIMFFGFEFILLGFIFFNIVDFKVHYPSLSFITILLGIVISFIGLLKKS
jgi:tryptophan-rich sensory protein